MPSKVDFGQWIGNKNVPSLDSATIDVENPSEPGSVIGTVPAGCKADADAALDAAKKAQPEWAKVPSAERAKVLKQIAQVVRDNREELIELLYSEQAKEKGLATAEVDFTSIYLDYYAGLAHSYMGEIIQSDNRGENIYLHYAPIGVSVGICPWNFPLFVWARKVAPALLAGCTVVVKSSEVTPLTTFRLMEHVTKAIDAGKVDLPSGVISVVTGYGNTIGAALVESPVPGIISMTGSVATGQRIMAAAAKNMTKVSLELGGKAPVIVMDDADIDKTVDAIVASRVIFSGQVCNCAERLYIQSKVYDEVVDKLVAKMKSTKVGLPTDEGVAYCSQITKEHREKISGMVERAVEAGAKVLCGGKFMDDGPGYCYEPTIIAGAAQDSEIMQKEVFGPVLPVAKFETFDEALALANDCEYGLTSSLYTNDYRLIERARTELLFGETYINRSHFEAIQGFHAGWRKSGVGGADGQHGLMEYFNTKVIYVQQ
uniref:Succinate-semialdehyde dehydrogenase, mitochondrial n=1 Tax=Pseudictyota dubia TaxID=2749911 RepID=A0A7R9VM33_9STRA|eukprot:CAMPEP_0197444050 /NCGR_PEP_ID=MMETSP1175-20131217/9629_1 /TAXON_ID=1003142 /ORGANISM="Triceratium dubium, Strain CCMP147" /LENGTH=486 /DNA_ID=CAMNT_0042974769 /DNA_START=69 /DNA_END=1529 /DNA_ORIENTATION=-